MRIIPVISLPQISDAAWRALTDQPEDPVEKILRENQIDLWEVLERANPA